MAVHSASENAYVVTTNANQINILFSFFRVNLELLTNRPGIHGSLYNGHADPGGAIITVGPPERKKLLRKGSDYDCKSLTYCILLLVL